MSTILQSNFLICYEGGRVLLSTVSKVNTCMHFNVLLINNKKFGSTKYQRYNKKRRCIVAYFGGRQKPIINRSDIASITKYNELNLFWPNWRICIFFSSVFGIVGMTV